MAVVKGLNSFQSDMGKIDSAIKMIVPSTSLLGGAFDFLGGIVNNFVSGAVNILEYALGGLLKDAIEAVASAISYLITQTIAAGNEFQMLSIRLTGLNLPASKAEIGNWADAMAVATEKTKEQLTWIQELGAATPFEPSDITQVYTMARAFGKTDEEARQLTKDIADYAAGMGLSSDKTVGLIQNFGQIIERGKIMGQTVRNMTRSAFLPWDDMVTRMAASMGVTKEALVKLISTAEGVPADVFIKAFQAMVEEEPRFIGASGRMARAFLPAVQNVEQLISSIGGLNILKPILDVAGEAVAKLVDQFVYFNGQEDLIKTDNWDKLSAAAGRVGEAVGHLLSALFNLVPSSGDFTKGLIDGLNNVATWIGLHQSDIVAWVQDAAKWIQDTLIPAIQKLWGWLFGSEGQDGAIQKFIGWLQGSDVKSAFDTANGLAQKLSEFLFGSTAVSDKGSTDTIPGALQNIYNTAIMLTPVINPLLTLLGSIGGVLSAAFGGGVDTSSMQTGIQGLVDGIQNLTKFINEHKTEISEMIRLWAAGAVTLMLFGAGIQLIIGIVSGLIVAFVGLIATNQELQGLLLTIGAALVVTGAIMLGLPGIIALVIAAVIGLSYWIYNNQEAIKTWATNTVNAINDWVANTVNAINGWVTDTGTKIDTWAGDTGARFNNWSSDTHQKILGWWSNTSAAFSGWSSETKATVSGWVSDVGSSLKGGFDNFKAWAGGFITDFMAKFSAAWGTVYNSGYEFIGHFMKGIVDRAEATLSVIMDIVNRIIAQINRLAGLSIPGITLPGIGGSGGGGGCFVAGTSVTMADGKRKAIEELIAGDTVLSMDTNSRTLIQAKVAKTLHHMDAPNPYYLILNDALKVTPNHRLFVNNEWIHAGDVGVGDQLLDENQNDITIVSIVRVDNAVPVYNIETDHPTHNYFAEGILVHNGGKSATGTHGLQTVPEGFPGDTWPLHLTSGERYMVIPKGGQMSSSMMGSSVSNQSQVQNTYNLNIASSAPTEPIISDFNMLASLN